MIMHGQLRRSLILAGYLKKTGYVLSSDEYICEDVIELDQNFSSDIDSK